MDDEPQQQLIRFGKGFLREYLGQRLIEDPRTALVELVANGWDAGATRVEIRWPEEDDRPLVIEDNGHGMTEEQFTRRWITLSYDRIAEQGSKAEFPEGVELPDRSVYGRNGKGRFAAFCFGSRYTVTTRRDGTSITYGVTRGDGSPPLKLRRLAQEESAGQGTTITVAPPHAHMLSSRSVRAELGMRFLTDPNFEVAVNGEQVKFEDVPDDNMAVELLDVPEVGRVRIVVIDTRNYDRTTNHHGIAWHVNGRLVGDCSWSGFSDRAFIDGRTSEARRLTFIVVADQLADQVEADWAGFRDDSEQFQKANEAVTDFIRGFLLKQTEERREEVYQRVRKTHSRSVQKMTWLSRDKWKHFVRKVQEDCPTLSEKNLTQLAGVLAQLELTEGKYGLIEALHRLDPDRLDNLHRLMETWTVDMAKVVLDELESRLRLLKQLKETVFDEDAKEVQDLQPLFERSLWIFGPEFETIEYTSNEGMTTVIQKVFGVDDTGSRNRPDFAIRPDRFVALEDSTVGLYSYPTYDFDGGGEIGIAKLVLVELKRAGVWIGEEEKAQCWRYVKELYGKGYLGEETQVECFVLGDRIDPLERIAREEMKGKVTILPMAYVTVIARANSRLLKLYDKVRSAPFLEGKLARDDVADEALRF